MKTLGQIQYESLEIADLEQHPWDKLPDWLKAVHERSAKAIADEVLYQVACHYQITSEVLRKHLDAREHFLRSTLESLQAHHVVPNAGQEGYKSRLDELALVRKIL